MSSYIPYSKRNGLEHGTYMSEVLDYVDRNTDLKIVDEQNGYYSFQSEHYHIGIHPDVMACCIDPEIESGTIFMMTPGIFFRTYKTLLPVIMDLYSK